MSHTTEQYLHAINLELIETKKLVLALSRIVTERMLDPGEVERTTKGAWVNATPDEKLTWNERMSGDEFVGHMIATGSRNLGRVLEIGPGYGRVLSTILSGQADMTTYLGVDISAANVVFLTTKFASPQRAFLNLDFLKDPVPGQYDTIYSSAVFLHLYPDISFALQKCKQLLAPGGRVCFDVPIGGLSYIHPVYKLFVHEYTEPLLREFVTKAGYSSHEILQENEFAPRTSGLFVCARA